MSAEPAARQPRPKRSGRRPGTPDTRGAILVAARTEFAAKGFDGASMRGIASAAQVDPSLVHHYFGNKEQLFAAAMQLPIDPGTIVQRVLDGDQADIGERLVRMLLEVWGPPATRGPFVALLRSAVTHEAAAAMFRQFMRRAVISRVAETLDIPDRELRVTLAASQIGGLLLMRYIIKIEPLASASDDEVVALVAPVIQHYLTP